MTHTNGTMVSLQERLNEPQTAAALNRLLDRIDALEQTMTTLTDAVQQAPGMVSMVTDIADETIQQTNRSGVNVEERIQQGLGLLTQLTEPQNAAVLTKLLSRMDQLEQLVALTEQAPGMMAMMGDIIDDTYRQASEAGIDIEAMVRSSAGAAMKLSEVTSSEEFDALMSSGMLDPKTLAVVGKAGTALVEAQSEPPRKIGLFGLMSALNDVDVQKTMGFLMNFAKHFGKAK